MKYSVVIPVYNKKSSIQATIQSVLAQTLRDYEVIVVNDGSTDDSLSVARSFEARGVRVIDQPNQGVSVARNTGILAAEGEYISFLDADDTWHPDYLETIDRLTSAHPESDFFVTAYRVLLSEGKTRFSTRLDPEEGCLPSYWETLSNSYDFVWTSATTVRRQALLNAGLFRPGEKVGQDLDMWARVAERNPRVAYSARVCVDYDRCAESNARTRNKVAYAEAFIRDLERQLKSPERSYQEKQAIQRKYDLKKTVHIFTCILSGQKKAARAALHSWIGWRTHRGVLLKLGLYGALIAPAFLCRLAYRIRLKHF